MLKASACFCLLRFVGLSPVWLMGTSWLQIFLPSLPFCSAAVCVDLQMIDESTKDGQ